MLKCSKCHEIKPSSEFYKRSGSKRGFKSHCKLCELAYHQTESAVLSHKESCARYQKTDKGRAASRSACKRFRETEAFKISTLKSRAKHPERRAAQIKVQNSIAAGKLVRPNKCSVCDEACTPEGHHTDYSKPLDVIWLCKLCHESAHHS